MGQLEERCPPGQDPIVWVPMRYSDDTMLQVLKKWFVDLTHDMGSSHPITSSESFIDAAVVAMPELSYLWDSPQEQLAHKTLRALLLCCSASPGVLRWNLEDENAALTYRCESLIKSVRGPPLDLAIQGENQGDKLEVLIICSLLRVIGRHAGFQRLYGGGCITPEEVIRNAIDHHPEVLPSVCRLPLERKELIVATLGACFPLELLMDGEIVPFHLNNIREGLLDIPEGINFLLMVVAIEYVTVCQQMVVEDVALDLVRLSGQCIAALEKHGAARAYELFLKKRAEWHSWRFARDNLLHHAVVRLCCFLRTEDEKAWSELSATMDKFSESEKDLLKTELAFKDGLNETPVYYLQGIGALMSAAWKNPKVTINSGLKMLIKILEAVAQSFDATKSYEVVTIQVQDLADRAQNFGGPEPFQGLPFTVERIRPSTVNICTVGSRWEKGSEL